MNESILIGLLIFGIIQSFFFFLLFSAKKNKTLPDKIIGIWLLILATQTFLILINIQQTQPIARNISLLITLLYGPILYLYVSKQTFENYKLTNRDSFHLIPFLLFLISLVLYPAENNLLIKLLSGTSSLLGIFYCSLTLYKLRNHRIKIITEFSYSEKINLVWVFRLTVGLLFIWIGVFLLVLLSKFLSIEIPLNWFFMIVPVFIFYIGYYGVKQQIIYSQNVNEQKKTIPLEKKQKIKLNENAYKKSGLQAEMMKKIHERLINSMQTDTLYHIPTLSLSELSTKLNIPSHHITQTLNDYANENFYDFVNRFRVEEFKIKVQADNAENFSLLGIAFNCGFNSKSSFNRIFKKFTGQSPSEYKKLLQ